MRYLLLFAFIALPTLASLAQEAPASAAPFKLAEPFSLVLTRRAQQIIIPSGSTVSYRMFPGRGHYYVRHAPLMGKSAGNDSLLLGAEMIALADIREIGLCERQMLQGWQRLAISPVLGGAGFVSNVFGVLALFTGAPVILGVAALSLGIGSVVWAARLLLFPNRYIHLKIIRYWDFALIEPGDPMPQPNSR